MNATVTAALISGGWATAASALGYAYNRTTTKATIQTTNANAMAALDAAHAAQLWDKRAEAYLDTIALIQRRLLARSGQPGAEDEAEKVALFFDSHDPDAWKPVVDRLHTYASPGVLEALYAANGAAGDALAAMHLRQMELQGMSDPRSDAVTADQAGELLTEADRADIALEQAMRSDLQQRPSQVLASQKRLATTA